MDISDDYLYVLIFIGIVVFNIIKTLRQSDKKEVRRVAPEVTEPEYDEEEDLDDRSRRDSFLISEEKTIDQMKSETESVWEEKTPKKTSSHLAFVEEEQKSLQVKLKTAEDARAAFIYSEIWNRKYC